MVLNTWCTVVWGTTSVLAQPWISGEVDNTSVLCSRLFASVLRRKKLGLTKLCSLKFGAGHRQLTIFTRKRLFLSLKWRRNFCRFKLHATCTCTSLMAAILWNTNSTRKDTRQLWMRNGASETKDNYQILSSRSIPSFHTRFCCCCIFLGCKPARRMGKRES